MASMRRDRAAAALVALAIGLSGGMARAADLDRGEDLYALCTACHGADASGNEMYLAPSLAGLEEWYLLAQLDKFRTGLRGGHPDDLAGMRMRPMSLWLKSQDDVAAVVSYVASLPAVDPEPELEGGDAANGEKLYALCSACHQADGAGNQALNAPTLLHSSDWYLLTQLANFKAGIRGGRPDDATGVQMRPMAMTLTDEQAMKDVIAYIMTLGK